MRHRIGNHGATTGADILDGGAGDEASALHGEIDLGAGLPEIKPVAGGDANAPAIAAGLRCRRLRAAPDFESGCPIVKPLAVGIGIPAFAQADRIEIHPQRGFVDRLFQRKCHRRPAGTAERRTGRQVADDVIIGELLGFRRIDQPGEGGERRVHGSAGVGMRRER